VIGPAEAQHPVLVHVAADDQSQRLAREQVRQTATASRRHEPVWRRTGQLGLGRGHRLMRDER
jgi:hypothetical protein